MQKMWAEGQNISGAELKNRYLVDEFIGRGGFAYVYRAHIDNIESQYSEREYNNDFVAIKVFPPEIDWNMVRQEVDILSKLSESGHQNLPKFIESGHEGGGYYCIVMSFVGDESLEEYLKSDAYTQSLTFKKLTQSLLDALAHLHGYGIIHRDLKPSNIRVAKPETAKQIYIVDFGLSKIYDRAQQSTPSNSGNEGTRYYSAPEVKQGRSSLHSDMFSLGATLYFVLTSKNPPVEVADRRTHTKFQNNLQDITLLSEEMRLIIARLMHWNPKRRYSEIRDIREKLEQTREYTSGSSIFALRNRIPETVLPKGHRRTLPMRQLMSVVALVVVALVVVALLAVPVISTVNSMISTAVASSFTSTPTPIPTETPLPTKTPLPTETPVPTPPPVAGLPAPLAYAVQQGNSDEYEVRIEIKDPNTFKELKDLEITSTGIPTGLDWSNGWLVFSGSDGKQNDLHFVSEKGQEFLADIKDSDEKYPTWNVNRLAFISDQNPQKKARIYVKEFTTNMKDLNTIKKPNTWKQITLTEGICTESDPEYLSWSSKPGSDDITFIAGKVLCVVDIKDGTSTVIDESGNSKRYPTWSPDGEQIAFLQDDGNGTEQLYTIRWKDETAKPIALTKQDKNAIKKNREYLTWYGDWIAFVVGHTPASGQGGDKGGIYKVNTKKSGGGEEEAIYSIPDLSNYGTISWRRDPP